MKLFEIREATTSIKIHTHIYIYIFIYLFFFFSMAQLPLVVQGLLIVEASRSYSDTPHQARLLRTSGEPDTGTFT